MLVLWHHYYFTLDIHSSSDDFGQPVATGRKRTKSKKRGSKLSKGLLALFFIYMSTVKSEYNGHPWARSFWSLYTCGC